MNRHLLIILRTCTVIQAASNTKRYINLPKREITKVCVSSLINSINQVKNHKIQLVVLDDHSSPEAVDDIKQIISHCKFPTEFIPVTDGTGNGHTMRKVYEQVETKCTDLWYHIEDDYLHVPEAIQDMLDSITQFESNTEQLVAINPHDDVWRYIYEIYESILLLGPYRHYRTVKHTTYTCLASKKIYNQYKKHFQDLVRLTEAKAPWVENQTINLVWNQPDVMLFSPIPSLAFHMMDESGKDLYFDIKSLWDSIPKLWLKDKPNIAVVCIYSDNQKDLGNITWENKKQYASKHGYKAFCKTDDLKLTPVQFEKFNFILDVMDKNPDLDWVWWLDNDALITNFDQKIENLVDDNYHIIMATDIASLNTGSFIVRNSQQARDWLKFLLDKRQEYKNDTKWFEQQAVIDFYPKFQNLFKIIPQKSLNSYDYKIYNVQGIDLLGNNGQWSVGDFVIHWPGLKNDLRIQLANYYKHHIQDTK